MRKIFMIEETLNEFAKRGRPRENPLTPIKPRGIDSPDSWNSDDEEDVVDPDELGVDTTDMETADEIEVEEQDVISDELVNALNNELKVPEFSRRSLEFRIKGQSTYIDYAVPMAKLGQNAFLFKLKNGQLKKIFLKDIILEQKKCNRAKTLNEFGYTEEEEGREEFARQMEEDHEYCPDNECEDHDCSEYTNRYGQCLMCGKWYETNEDEL